MRMRGQPVARMNSAGHARGTARVRASRSGSRLTGPLGPRWTHWLHGAEPPCSIWWTRRSRWATSSLRAWWPVGARMSQVRGCLLACLIPGPQHLGVIRSKWTEIGEPMPIALAIGVEPGLPFVGGGQ